MRPARTPTHGLVILITLAALAPGACAPTVPSPVAQGDAGAISPSWSSAASRTR